MGQETHCRARFAGEEAQGRALLETDELIFRGGFRVAVPYTQITSVAADGENLVVRFPKGVLELELGARTAQRWAQRIHSPKTRIDKLGVKPGMRVAIVGSLHDGAFSAELAGVTADVRHGRVPPGTDVIFLAAQRTRDLQRLERLRSALAPDGAIWVIRPRGVKEITEHDVMSMGKAAGLVDTKVVRFSDTHTAEKLVIPRDRR